MAKFCQIWSHCTQYPTLARRYRHIHIELCTRDISHLFHMSLTYTPIYTSVLKLSLSPSHSFCLTNVYKHKCAQSHSLLLNTKLIEKNDMRLGPSQAIYLHRTKTRVVTFVLAFSRRFCCHSSTSYIRRKKGFILKRN